MQLVIRDMRFMAMKLVHNHLHELDSIVPALAVLYGSISSFSITRRPITDTHDRSLANISHGDIIPLGVLSGAPPSHLDQGGSKQYSIPLST